MTLKETLENQIVRVYDNGVPCLSTANVSEYEVIGASGFIDKATNKLVIDIDIKRVE